MFNGQGLDSPDRFHFFLEQYYPLLGERIEVGKFARFEYALSGFSMGYRPKAY